ncbi:YigZ family protein [Motiliproteus sediminis]|uniref:YigZ family protein n=1 Tax=Motiliproteus sediminis TaxID=1468178 RepID=UPI001AF01CA9|nr:YigZ family protein [Motiliproteus sediminis]
MSQPYPVPVAAAEVETEVRKSRFIARALPCSDREQAMALLAQARLEFADARHHCWAYQLGDPACPQSAAMSDDGEPSGTAGKPILNVISHRGIGDLMVIVIRYFGGIKLGAGGLVRAYGQAAGQALDALRLEQTEPCCNLTARLDFAQEQRLRYWLQQHQGSVVQIDYAERVCVALILPERHLEQWSTFCRAHGVETTP